MDEPITTARGPGGGAFDTMEEDGADGGGGSGHTVQQIAHGVDGSRWSIFTRWKLGEKSGLERKKKSFARS